MLAPLQIQIAATKHSSIVFSGCSLQHPYNFVYVCFDVIESALNVLQIFFVIKHYHFSSAGNLPLSSSLTLLTFVTFGLGMLAELPSSSSDGNPNADCKP
jgi:hypothetical protein